MIRKLLIGITFHYSYERLRFLQEVAARILKFQVDTVIFVVTNTSDRLDRSEIENCFRDFSRGVGIHTPYLLGHPYLLTWAHLEIFRDFFLNDETISHFLYMEDDLGLSVDNIKYWVVARELLRPTGLIPSFLRYERDCLSGTIRSTDIPVPLSMEHCSRIIFKSKDYGFVNVPFPYQGMYLLDRELAEEHLWGPSSSPDFGDWNIREKAAQGLTFAAVPPGFSSRNVLGYLPSVGSVDSAALIHHLPNNYADNAHSPFGKVAISDIFIGTPKN